MIGLVAMLAGGLVAVAVLSLLWEWALFKRITDDPVKGKVGSVIAAWLTAGTLAGFGMADGGPFVAFAYMIYFIPAALLGVWAYHRGKGLREEAPDNTELADIFE